MRGEADKSRVRVALREMRKNTGLTQAQLASELGMSRSFYGLIETGLREPSLSVALTIAKYFNTTIEALFFCEYWQVYQQKCAER